MCGSEGSSPGGWGVGIASIDKMWLSTNLLRSMFVNPGSHHYISCIVLNMVSLKRYFHYLQHFTWIFISSLIRRENMFIGLMNIFSSNFRLCFCSSLMWLQLCRYTTDSTAHPVDMQLSLLQNFLWILNTDQITNIFKQLFYNQVSCLCELVAAKWLLTSCQIQGLNYFLQSCPDTPEKPGNICSSLKRRRLKTRRSHSPSKPN